MTVAEKISALYEEISALDNERAELEERYCENCQERRCNNCWAELRGKEDENDLPYCGFKNCQYWFDGNCTKPSGQEKCEYWYLLHEESEVIRCKDCKHIQKWRSEESAKKFGQIYECARDVLACPKPDDFCSKAERRGDSK